MSADSGSNRVGEDLHSLASELFPICRSITGNGVRETLEALRLRIPLEVREIPSGTQVLDWTVPPEWNVKEAWIEGPDGGRVVDFADHTLHLVGYSEPTDAKLTFAELRPHLHTLPEQPQLIPYRTSYWNRTWGFCLRHDDFERMPEDGTYTVHIDSSLEVGALTWGEYVIEGDSIDEVLVSTHICHPSLCNDNLSGIVVATALAEWVAVQSRRYTYRFLFVPATIGSIAWLARSEAVLPSIRHGMVLAGVGGPGRLTWKRTRRGHCEIDRATELAIRDHEGRDPQTEDFSPYGYDERQYCSPGFDLPVGCLMRAPWGTYPEYHTSGDDLEFVAQSHLSGALDACKGIVEVLEGNARYRNLAPKGEPQLGRRGLYARLGGAPHERHSDLMAILWVLNQSDGDHDLIEIAVRSNLPFSRVRWAADQLLQVGLIEEA